MLRGRVLPRKFEKIHNWAKPSPRYNPAIMHRTKTGILRKIREIEAVSMGVETVQGYNLHRPPGCNPKTRDHKQASIFVEFADVFRLSPWLVKRTCVHEAAASRAYPTYTAAGSDQQVPISGWMVDMYCSLGKFR